MTEIYCTFNDCIYNQPHDENYGTCEKDRITLDANVEDIMCGCPDAKWNEPQTEPQTERSE